MATYAIGDIHGCFLTFKALLKKFKFDPTSDYLWLVGDLVNRGPRNLETLAWVYEHEARVTAVLGNHDLYLIRRHLGLSEAKASETLDDVLKAPERDQLSDWLRYRPLIHDSGGFVLVHAGILPCWDLANAVQAGRAAEKQLRDDPEALFDKSRAAPIANLAGDTLTTRDVARILTGLRLCSSANQWDPAYTGPPEAASPPLKPWFTFREVVELDRVFVFGHWAQMGCRIQPHAYCLDSGCVYGGPMSAIRLDDGQLFQQANLEN